MKALDWVKFLRAVSPGLIELAKLLFRRHQGRADLARADLARMRDQWLDFDKENARIDRENAELKH